MTNNDLVPELANCEFEKLVKEGTVFVDFFADWCMPCVMMGPIIDDLAEEFSSKLNFCKVNVEDNSSIAGKYNICSIPTFILFKDGEVVEQLNGAKTQEELSDIIKKHL